MKDTDNRSTRHDSIIGKRFARLVVVEQCKSTKGKRTWLCQCDCGNKHRVITYLLTSEQVKSCGCLKTDSKVIARRIGKNPYSLSPARGMNPSKTE
jgi:hypothetical protein